MRGPISENQKKLLEQVEPYIVKMLPKVVYKEGTPKEIKEKHKELIELAFQEACDQ